MADGDMSPVATSTPPSMPAQPGVPEPSGVQISAAEGGGFRLRLEWGDRAISVRLRPAPGIVQAVAIAALDLQLLPEPALRWLYTHAASTPRRAAAMPQDSSNGGRGAQGDMFGDVTTRANYVTPSRGEPTVMTLAEFLDPRRAPSVGSASGGELEIGSRSFGTLGESDRRELLGRAAALGLELTVDEEMPAGVLRVRLNVAPAPPSSR